MKAAPKPKETFLKRAGETSEELFEKLFEAILNGELKPGSTIRQAKLAREWNVSRTPMREAVRRAAEEGYLLLRNNNTPVVRHLTGEDVTGLYNLREILEVHALKRAFPHIDRQALTELREVAEWARPDGENWEKRCLEFDLRLHSCWTTRCGNKWLESDIKRQFQFLQIFQRWIGHDTKVLRHTYEQHEGILAALEDGNSKLAQKKLIQHINDSMKHVSATLTKS